MIVKKITPESHTHCISLSNQFVSLSNKFEAPQCWTIFSPPATQTILHPTSYFCHFPSRLNLRVFLSYLLVHSMQDKDRAKEK